MSSLHKGWKGERLKVKRIVEKGGKKIGRKKVDKENSTKKKKKKKKRKESARNVNKEKKKKKLTKTSYFHILRNLY